MANVLAGPQRGKGGNDGRERPAPAGRRKAGRLDAAGAVPRRQRDRRRPRGDLRRNRAGARGRAQVSGPVEASCCDADLGAERPQLGLVTPARRSNSCSGTRRPSGRTILSSSASSCTPTTSDRGACRRSKRKSTGARRPGRLEYRLLARGGGVVWVREDGRDGARSRRASRSTSQTLAASTSGSCKRGRRTSASGYWSAEREATRSETVERQRAPRLRSRHAGHVLASSRSTIDSAIHEGRRAGRSSTIADWCVVDISEEGGSAATPCSRSRGTARRKECADAPDERRSRRCVPSSKAASPESFRHSASQRTEKARIHSGSGRSAVDCLRPTWRA